MKGTPRLFEVPPAGVEKIDSLADFLAGTVPPGSSPRAVAEACATAAQQVPESVREFLGAYRDGALGTGPVVVRLSPAAVAELAPTPGYWKSSLARGEGWRFELHLLLLGSLLGQPFGWCTQQAGRLVHDVLPIREDEDEQIGTGSRQRIHFHIEDAYSDFRARYIGLFCLRNPGATATTYSVPDLSRLLPPSREALRQAQYFIEPDKSQEAPLASWTLPALHRIPVLETGESPDTLRLDPYFMPRGGLTGPACEALDQLLAEIERAMDEVVLQPGDCLFIDNAHCLHGRSPFQARYDGRDRWLKRLNIATRPAFSRAVQDPAGTLSCLPSCLPSRLASDDESRPCSPASREE